MKLDPIERSLLAELVASAADCILTSGSKGKKALALRSLQKKFAKIATKSAQ